MRDTRRLVVTDEPDLSVAHAASGGIGAADI
jgi:hypothetical protein